MLRARRFIRRLTLAFFLVLLASPAQLQFIALPRDTIEARLSKSSRKLKERQQILAQFFEEAGCSGDKFSEQEIRNAGAPNLVCILPGQEDRVILVGAHYDRAGDGDGIADNWSGASLLSSLYQGLSRAPRRHTFVFVAFSGEEQGLIGSAAYAKKLKPEDISRTDAMVNLDTLGLGPTNVWVSNADPALKDAAGRLAAAMKTPIRGVNIERVGSTDSESFRKRKIATIAFHSVTQENFSTLHTSKDRLSAIRLDDYYETYRFLSAYLAYLDTLLGQKIVPDSSPRPN